MKLRIQQLGLLIVSTLTIHCSFAQIWQEDANGIYPTSLGKYVGINTNTPGAALDVDNSILMGINGPAYGVRIKINLPGYNGGWARGFSITNEDNTKKYFGLGVVGNATAGVTTMSYAWLGKSYEDAAMYFLSNGNVGIGTTIPRAKLEVMGEIKGYTQLHVGENYDAINGRGITVDNGGSTSWELLTLRNDFGTHLKITGDGNVGIGTTTPTEKLSVNGNIKAKKLIVTQNGWADYVFNKEYTLMPLKDLSTYIGQHKHLPEMPSTTDVETNGVDVGTNQALLLKKVEELTLYILQQQKEIDVLKEEIQKRK